MARWRQTSAVAPAETRASASAASRGVSLGVKAEVSVIAPEAPVTLILNARRPSIMSTEKNTTPVTNLISRGSYVAPYARPGASEGSAAMVTADETPAEKKDKTTCTSVFLYDPAIES